MVNIRTRLGLIFGIVSLLCFALTAAGLYGMADANRRAARIYSELSLPSQYLKDGYVPVLVTALQIYEANALADPAASQGQFQVADEMRKHIDEQTERLSRSKVPADIEPALQEYLAVLARAVAASDEALALSKRGEAEASSVVVREKSRPNGLRAAQLMGQLTAVFNHHIEAANAEAAAAYKRMRDWMLCSLIAGAALGGSAILILMQSISGSLSDMQGTLYGASHSLDLSMRAHPRRPDEIGRTAAAFNSLMERVEAAIGGVRQATDAVFLAAREIAAGNSDLSQRTERQAVAVETATAKVSQLNQTLAVRAKDAQAARALADEACNLADHSDHAVVAVVRSIEAISDGAARITEITSLIEGIAFRTNILALNAAVEAARAGEQGRGFAVVASEVRDLAQRSSTAAREIKALIDSSTEKVGDGTRHASSAGNAMKQLRQAIVKVSATVEEIAASSLHESGRLTQISDAMHQLDGLTQENAALVEQAAGASALLEEQADRLQHIVASFKLKPAASGPASTSLRHTHKQQTLPR